MPFSEVGRCPYLRRLGAPPVGEGFLGRLSVNILNVIRVRAVGKSVKTLANAKVVIEQVIPDELSETNSRGFVAFAMRPQAWHQIWQNLQDCLQEQSYQEDAGFIQEMK